MIDALRCYELLDERDPRLHPVVTHDESRCTLAEAFRRNQHDVELILSILDRADDNVLRIKAKSVLHAIQDVRQKKLGGA